MCFHVRLSPNGRLVFRRFALVQKHTVEFNQVAMANSEGSEVMLNRVMTKDNIGVAVLLEVNKDMFSGGKNSWEPPRNSRGWGCDALEPQGVSVDLA